MTDVVALRSKAAVMTEEEGTVSGALDVGVDASGRAFVRYRGTENWLTIGNLDGDPPRRWRSAFARRTSMSLPDRST